MLGQNVAVLSPIYQISLRCGAGITATNYSGFVFMEITPKAGCDM
jgi:hypothetical protein